MFRDIAALIYIPYLLHLGQTGRIRELYPSSYHLFLFIGLFNQFKSDAFEL